MNTPDFLGKLQAVKKTSAGWEARCPAHEDGKASLSIAKGKDGRILLNCFAGCPVEKIVGALGLKLADLFAENSKRNGAAKKIVAAYDYFDSAGTVLFQVVRFEPKDFRQRKSDGRGGWTWNTKGVEKVLFRLPEIASEIQRGLPVFLCEGERDVLAMVERGFAATCNPGGAGKWLNSFSETLRDAEVIIVADKDEPGREHAQLVASKIQSSAKRVRLIELPDLNGEAVKDASDFFSAGGTPESLTELATSAADWIPIESKEKTESRNAADGSDFDKLTAWIRGEIISILLSDTPPASKRPRIAKIVVEALEKLGRFYFHADRRDFDSAMFFDSHRKRLERIRSDAFAAWLSHWLSLNRADSIFKFTFAAVETAALSGPATTGILPESFWTARPGAIYLSNGDGSLIKVTADGVQRVDNGTDGVLFAAGRTLAPWTIAPPIDPFEVCGLFRNSHCSAQHGRDLLRLWLYSLPTNPRSKPPLCLAGEIGSGKTRLAKGVAELFGAPVVIAKVEETLEANFWPSVNEGGIFTLDNADSKCRWLADAIANAATDGCSQRRKLYTNSETVILRARSWLAVTTANPTFASDAGLADRLLVVRMERSGEETSDAKLTDEILVARDAALSHIAATLRKALADTKPTPPGLNARHPDFASFAVRIGRALGREAEAVGALKAAEADKAAFCLENDSIASALLGYLREARTFSGTAAELLPKLCEADADLKDRLSAKRLGKRLSMLWPHLEKNLATANKESDRKGITVFRFAAGCAGFQTPLPVKSVFHSSRGEFRENTETNPANPANVPEDELLI